MRYHHCLQKLSFPRFWGDKVMQLREYMKCCQGEFEKNFPSIGIDFCDKLASIYKYLEENIYPNVVVGASARDGMVLTNHSKEHVETVIQRMSLLLGDGINRITGYEVFILLVAACLHDIGNISGRSDHEKHMVELANGCQEFKTLDGPTKHYIFEVAMAHGGRNIKGGKDTLSLATKEEKAGGILVRPRAMAALLRFADELSDDFGRANIAMMNIGSIPPESNIYHLYSSCVQTPNVQGAQIFLRYDLTALQTQRLYDKVVDGQKRGVYLYDEIKERLAKCYGEMEYCTHHSDGLFHFDSINATIVVFTDDYAQKIIEYPICLKYNGYPDKPVRLDDVLGETLVCATGQMLAAEIQSKLKKIQPQEQ